MECYEARIIKDKEKRLEWFREAKFGMFIHWGLYSHLAGSWKGKEVPNLGSHIMRHGRIPRKDYRKVAADFNPTAFDAKKIVALAKKAGMRYIVITAKHHDGFAMYNSTVSDYNIVKASPYGQDPMKDLAKACQEEKIKLCFYYSHRQDWDHPHGYIAKPPLFKDPLWDPEFLPEEEQCFEQYMDEKAIPQVVELLTGYGDIGIMWYDTPGGISDYNAERFARLVRAIQPDCLVSPRVSGTPEIGDYLGFEDNQVPYKAPEEPWEVCATMNATWGFKAQDTDWKSTKELLQLLISIVAQGGNYLLNIGPTDIGEVPEASIQRLEEIGRWMEVHEESIHQAQGKAVIQQPSWGAVTQGEDSLYLHLFEPPKDTLFFAGLKNQVKDVILLSTGESLAFFQEQKTDLPLHCLQIALPESLKKEPLPVIKVVFKDTLSLQQYPNDYAGNVLLESHSASIVSTAKQPQLQMDPSGVISHWVQLEDFIQWSFIITTPGTFAVHLHTLTVRYPQRFSPNWEGGHTLTLTSGKNSFAFTVTDDKRTYPRNNQHWENVITYAGELTFAEAGQYTIELHANDICFNKGLGITVKGLELIPK